MCKEIKLCIMEKFYDIYFNFLGEGVSDKQTDEIESC